MLNLFDEYPEEHHNHFQPGECEACGWDEGLMRTKDGDSCPDCAHTINRPQPFSVY